MDQTDAQRAEWEDLVMQRFQASQETPRKFFDEQAERISEACYQMARRFYQGGRILTFGEGFWVTDAQHVAVEFVHPAIMGNRALPGLALSNNNALITSNHADDEFAHGIRMLAHPIDIALAFSTTGRSPNVVKGLQESHRKGLLTIGLSGPPGFSDAAVDYGFSVDTPDAFVLQETHETLCHVLYELVHVFLEQEAILV